MYYWAPYYEKMNTYTVVKNGYLDKIMMARLALNYAEKSSSSTLKLIDATYRGTTPIGVKFKFKYTQAYGDTGPVVVTESWPEPDGTEIFPGELTTNTINVS